MQILKRARIIVPILLLLFGFGYVLWPHIDIAVAGREAAPISSITSSVTEEIDFKAISHLSIPRLAVDLEVKTGGYDRSQETWLLDDTHAFFMPESTTPLVYGHAIPAVFGRLQGMRQGDIVEIVNDGRTYTFQYKQDRHITPDDLAILHEKAPRTVFLMTCSGAWCEQRRIFELSLVEAQ